MKLNRHIAACLIIILLMVTGQVVRAAVGLQNLRCEMLVNPQGIDTATPRLSWQITGSERGIMQKSYQILVASSPAKLVPGKADLWDSHQFASDQSIMIDYAGKPVGSRAECYWVVKVWTNKGETGWSKPAKWSVGLLKPTDWAAKWIGYDKGFDWDSVSKFSRLSARYFRKEFNASQDIKKATVYIAGLGHYELYLNGHQIGDQVLAQVPTDYTQSVKYNTFDVTADLQKGENAIGVTLGNGRFFTMRPKYKPKKIKEFGFPKMLLQLEIIYADGHKQRIISDDSWKFTADGPIRTNNEYDGEEYDATKELTNWTNTGYNASTWLKPKLVDAPGGKLEGQMNEFIKVVKIVKPIGLSQLKPGSWILDMGQNMAGWLQMKVKGKRADKVTLRYAETLQKGGDLFVANLRDAKVTDTYTLNGGAAETWHPVFVFHGFRYVEIDGWPGTPSLDDFEGQAVSDDMDNIGRFETSDTLINRIYQNAWWGILSNYKGMPIDCPQRNERMPWLGDRAVGSLGEGFVFDNDKLYAQWLDDIEQSQKADGSLPDVAPAYWNYYSDNMTWPGTYILIADMLYTQYGDKGPIKKHYASMKKWLDYMRDKYVKGDLMTKDKYGDWCVPPESATLIHTKDTLRTTNGELIASAYYYRLLTLMGRFADLVKKPQDRAAFESQAAKTASAFNQKFLDKKTFRYDNNAVTANLLPLFFGITPQADRKAVFENIVNKIVNENGSHISTGVVGTQWLMRGLTGYGRPDVALNIVNQTDYPSWGYMVKHGATTIWELWNGDTADPAMNSHNHVMLLGDLIAWFYQDLAGIAASEPGFKNIRMKVTAISGLDSVKSTYKTPYGMIASNWVKTPGEFRWKITVPPNSKAMVTLPAKDLPDINESSQSIAKQKDIKYLGAKDGGQMVEIGSGTYEFHIRDFKELTFKN